ncbi:MAG: nucleoside-diphosphate kinase [Candidatus Odinarchaeum yellowstonii]|uniref:nucleoside-diphosphate kinase n=1 Tax=Odinarchaeota yellowstonii (strain LCB_4) TaxID=1841599 RepID=A0AAF0IC80_ODILC|nr:MAG: nucleoside-diphosphate kinase [Candidatus Odinarchaeum yellowstonii]
MIQNTLVLLKPDAYLRRYIGACVLREFRSERTFKIKAFKEVTASRSLAEKHYDVHREKPFFKKLVDYLTLGPVIAMVVEGENVIPSIRLMLGSTFSEKAEPHTIRGKYGIWNGINVVHASDGDNTAKYEIKLWREEAGVEEMDFSRVNLLIDNYIEKWSKLRIDNTLKLREICRLISIGESRFEDCEQKIFKLLREECIDSDESIVKKFVKIIADNLQDQKK